MEKIFRYSIKAVIIRDGKLLVESCDYGRGRFCKLPGGGHQWGETMEQALIRECREELNLTDRLADSDFFPQAIVPWLKNIDKVTQTIVLGDVN